MTWDKRGFMVSVVPFVFVRSVIMTLHLLMASDPQTWLPTAGPVDSYSLSGFEDSSVASTSRRAAAHTGAHGGDDDDDDHDDTFSLCHTYRCRTLQVHVQTGGQVSSRLPFLLLLPANFRPDTFSL